MECEVVRLVFSRLCSPQLVLKPYWTSDVAPLSVVQVIVAPEVETFEDATTLTLAGAMTGVE